MAVVQSSARRDKVPPGVSFIQVIRGKDFGFNTYRVTVLVVTFLAYACYHASRKPLSIVKSVLDPEDPSLRQSAHVVLVESNPWAGSPANSPHASTSASASEVIGWVPFNGKLGKARLGETDLAFLASYAIGMYFSGRLGDRLDLRMFLTFGMVGSGCFVCLFGMGYWWEIHLFSYYFIVQVITGMLSATGWPAVVAIMANWYGKRKRGLIMGIWNAHTSVGNIVGSLIAASALHHGWGWSFVLLGVLIILGGFLVFLFLVVAPVDVGLPSPYEQLEAENDEESCKLLELEVRKNSAKVREEGHAQVPISFMANEMPGMTIGNDTALYSQSLAINGNSSKRGFEALEHQKIPFPRDISRGASHTDEFAIGFLDAWRIPGVASYAFCLFFVKLVAYTFLFWLPFYIRHTEIAGRYLTDKMAGFFSTLFDAGGVVGGVLAGHLSDKYNVSAIVATSFVCCAIPSLFIFRAYASASLVHLIILLILSGVFVNGPYALITTAVSANLGTHSSLNGNAKALATVTAIIDGTGSIGAAVGPFFTGYISVRSWYGVFVMLALSSFVAGLLLTRLVVAELREKLNLQRASAMEELKHQDLPDDDQTFA